MGNIEKTILENQPTGFLQQLGEDLGSIVGLGRPETKSRSHWITAIEIPVRTKKKVLGIYTIVKDKEYIMSIAYDGSHPLASRHRLKKIGLSCGMNDNRCPGEYHLVRKDGWKEIVFPGIGQYENAHANIDEVYSHAA